MSQSHGQIRSGFLVSSGYPPGPSRDPSRGGGYPDSLLGGSRAGLTKKPGTDPPGSRPRWRRGSGPSSLSTPPTPPPTLIGSTVGVPVRLWDETRRGGVGAQPSILHSSFFILHPSTLHPSHPSIVSFLDLSYQRHFYHFHTFLLRLFSFFSYIVLSPNPPSTNNNSPL